MPMMQRFRQIAGRWTPSFVIMIAIFSFSAQPASALPRFGWADFVIKKGGHMLGFGLLSLAYWSGLRWDRSRTWLAWILAVCYAVTDEFHQVYVAGRHPSPVDVVLFDATGAALALGLRRLWLSGRSRGSNNQDAAGGAGGSQEPTS